MKNKLAVQMLAPRVPKSLGEDHLLDNIKEKYGSDAHKDLVQVAGLAQRRAADADRVRDDAREIRGGRCHFYVSADFSTPARSLPRKSSELSHNGRQRRHSRHLECSSVCF